MNVDDVFALGLQGLWDQASKVGKVRALGVGSCSRFVLSYPVRGKFVDVEIGTSPREASIAMAAIVAALKVIRAGMEAGK